MTTILMNGRREGKTAALNNIKTVKPQSRPLWGEEIPQSCLQKSSAETVIDKIIYEISHGIK